MHVLGNSPRFRAVKVRLDIVHFVHDNRRLVNNLLWHADSLLVVSISIALIASKNEAQR